MFKALEEGRAHQTAIRKEKLAAYKKDRYKAVVPKVLQKSKFGSAVFMTLFDTVPFVSSFYRAGVLGDPEANIQLTSELLGAGLLGGAGFTGKAGSGLFGKAGNALKNSMTYLPTWMRARNAALTETGLAGGASRMNPTSITDEQIPIIKGPKPANFAEGGEIDKEKERELINAYVNVPDVSTDTRSNQENDAKAYYVAGPDNAISKYQTRAGFQESVWTRNENLGIGSLRYDTMDPDVYKPHTVSYTAGAGQPLSTSDTTRDFTNKVESTNAILNITKHFVKGKEGSQIPRYIAGSGESQLPVSSDEGSYVNAFKLPKFIQEGLSTLPINVTGGAKSHKLSQTYMGILGNKNSLDYGKPVVHPGAMDNFPAALSYMNMMTELPLEMLKRINQVGKYDSLYGYAQGGLIGYANGGYNDYDRKRRQLAEELKRQSGSSVVSTDSLGANYGPAGVAINSLFSGVSSKITSPSFGKVGFGSFSRRIGPKAFSGVTTAYEPGKNYVTGFSDVDKSYTEPEVIRKDVAYQNAIMAGNYRYPEVSTKMVKRTPGHGAALGIRRINPNLGKIYPGVLMDPSQLTPPVRSNSAGQMTDARRLSMLREGEYNMLMGANLQQSQDTGYLKQGYSDERMRDKNQSLSDKMAKNRETIALFRQSSAMLQKMLLNPAVWQDSNSGYQEMYRKVQMYKRAVLPIYSIGSSFRKKALLTKYGHPELIGKFGSNVGPNAGKPAEYSKAYMAAQKREAVEGPALLTPKELKKLFGGHAVTATFGLNELKGTTVKTTSAASKAKTEDAFQSYRWINHFQLTRSS